MSTVKRRRKVSYLSPGTGTLLAELGEECQRVVKLLAQLEIPSLKETQVEALLGELSAAILGEKGRQPELLSFLEHETEGNVFFLVEVVLAIEVLFPDLHITFVGKAALGPFQRQFEAAQGFGVLVEVLPMLFFKLGDDVLD